MTLLSRLARWGCTVMLALLLARPVRAQDSSPQDLTQASLEDLLNVKITTVTKKEQTLRTAGAAVFVITQEDIRESGATNIPDLLRMVPGVNVARMSTNTWAISIRGFNDSFADKVLVLIDGRSVYNPITSGVSWDQQDVPLEDIERIEVIRGPGGTVWGANAMNGVINIITKNAQNTQGGIIVAGGGSETVADGLAQYGGAIGSAGTYRVFGKSFDIDSSTLPAGGSAHDGWQSVHGGFRSDWVLSPSDTLTVQGDLQEGREGQNLTVIISNPQPQEGTFTDRFGTSAGNVLARWNHTLASGSEMSLQIYDDQSSTFSLGSRDRQNTVDLDFQHHLKLGSRQDIVWGLGSRVANLYLGTGYGIAYVPPSRTDVLLSTFFQDQVKISGALSFTFGSKFEHNDYTGFELEPSAQLVWNPAPRHSAWLSAARAVRQPDAVDASIRDEVATFPTDPGSYGVVEVAGNPHQKAESLNDFEAGYRLQATARLSLDVATFLNFYHDLRTAEELEPYLVTRAEVPYLVLPVAFENIGHAHAYGGELFLDWKPVNRWRISSGYARLHMVIFKDAANVDTEIGDSGTGTPRQQFQVRSAADLPHHFEWDSSLDYVGRLAAGIPAYTRVDTRLGRRISEHLDVSAVGQNLLSPRHAEFPDDVGVNHTLVARSVFVKFTFKF
jgi:iron complex outermembrane recepter protein